MTTAFLVLGLLSDLGAWLTPGGLPLDVVQQAREPVYPSRGNGFAAAVLGALVALGLLVLMMMFISSKPKNRRR